MFSNFKRMIGNITVEENDKEIRIDGLPADIIQRDIQRIWSTNRINQWMFSRISRSSITFPKFFAIDVLYALETILSQNARHSNARGIRKVIAQMREFTWLNRIGKSYPDILDFSQLQYIKFTALPHQKDFLERYNRVVPEYGLNGLLLSAAAGTGKTFTSLALSLCLRCDVVVIISPNNAVFKVWDSSVTNLIKDSPKAWVAQEKQPLTGDRKYYIFHYEALEKALDLFTHYNFKNPIIVLDESHNFNETSASRTNMFVEVCKKAKCRNVIWSSGTPIKAVGNEAIPLLRTIDPLFTDDAEMRFRKIFGKSTSRAVDILRNRIGLVSFKVKMDVVMTEAPISHTVKVKIPDAERYTLENLKAEMSAFVKERMEFYLKNMKSYAATYNHCLSIHEDQLHSKAEHEAFSQYKQFVRVIQKGYDPVLHKVEALYCNKYELGNIMPTLPQHMKPIFKDVRSIIKYPFLKVQGECLGRILGKRRSDCTRAMVRHCGLDEIINNAEKKTVVFSSYVDVVAETNKYLVEHGFDPVLVYAETNKDISANVTKFEKEEDANPIVATFQSLSTAVPLIVANTVVMLNSPFRHFEYEQAVARVARLGQDTQTHVWNIVLDTGEKSNISSRSIDIMEWSRKQVEAMMSTESTLISDMALESEDFSVDYYMALYKPEISNEALDSLCVKAEVYVKPASLEW